MDYDDSIPASKWTEENAASTSESTQNLSQPSDIDSEDNARASVEESEEYTSDDAQRSNLDMTPVVSSQSIRGRKAGKSRTPKFIPKSDRHTRSSSSQRRKRSEEAMASSKKSKQILLQDNVSAPDVSESYASVYSQPEMNTNTEIENCMERVMEKFATKMTKKIELCQAETIMKFDSVNESLDKITARITIMENEQKKISTEHSEKILVNENSIIANTHRISVLEAALEEERMKTKIMSNTVDNLEQASRSANMFVAGLSAEQATKDGFVQFCGEKLQVPSDPLEIKSIFKIPSERETLYKIIFKTPEIREKFYSARKLLKDHRQIWFRDDLTRKRENLAKRIREMVKGSFIKKCWTDHGVILIIRNGETKPTRINDLSEI